MKNPLSRSGAHSVSAHSFARRAALSAALACGALAPAAARAASLTGPVSGWSSGVPSYISMYEYIPAKLAASPPIVVAAHYCGGSAQAFFGFTGMPGIEAAADQYGFIMIFPQTTNPASSADCWDVGSPKSLTHNGGGDTQAIAEMVQYEITKRNADPTRVYIIGASSGAMLTEAMLAVYPDVFKAGAEFSGVPAGCWSDGWSAASNWGGTCANGQDSMTAQAWGSLVRAMYPAYTGAYPRIQLWHGTADATINYNNEGEAIKEWTNLLGLSATPNTNTMASGFTIETWQNTCGFTVLEAHIQAGGGHTTPIDDTSVINFFGLSKTGPDPQAAACGGTGTGGSSGTAGTTGGSAGHGGTSGGSAGAGGHAGTAGGGAAGTTGTAGTGGHAGTTGGGTAGTNGTGTGGRAGTTGGVAGTTGGGSAGTSGDGAAGTFGGGIAGTNGTGTGTGGHAEAGTTGNTTGTGGHAEAGTVGTTTGGTTGNTGVGGESGGSSPGESSGSGCSCAVASGTGGAGALSALALAALGLALGRRPRRRR